MFLIVPHNEDYILMHVFPVAILSGPLGTFSCVIFQLPSYIDFLYQKLLHLEAVATIPDLKVSLLF